VNDIRQTEIHTAEPLVPEPSVFEFEIATEELKRHKSPVVDQIPAELIKKGSRKIRSEIHILINSIWNKKELPEEWKKSIILSIYKKCDKTYIRNNTGLSLFSKTYSSIQHPVVKVNSICRRNYWGSSVWISKQQVN